MSATTAINLARSNMPSKWKLHSELINTFTLQSDEINALDRYYILHWQPAHFLQEMKEGIIVHQDIKYLVIYKNCNIIKIRNAPAQIALSFRKPKAEYNLCNYVIVKVI